MCPNVSKCVQMCPNVSKCVQMCPNVSKSKRNLKSSHTAQEPKHTCKIFLAAALFRNVIAAANGESPDLSRTERSRPG